MFVEAPLLTRCCFCVPLRPGLLVWAYLKLIFNILTFGCGLIILSTVGGYLFFFDCVYYVLAVVLSALILFFLDIIFNFVLIVGCHKKNTTLLRLYYRFGIAYAVLLLLLGISAIGLLLYLVMESENEDSELVTKDLWNFNSTLSYISCIFLILHVYLVLMVRSAILKLKPSGHFQFVNLIADSKFGMQVDYLSKDKDKKMFSAISVDDAAKNMNSSEYCK